MTPVRLMRAPMFAICTGVTLLSCQLLSGGNLLFTCSAYITLRPEEVRSRLVKPLKDFQ